MLLEKRFQRSAIILFFTFFCFLIIYVYEISLRRNIFAFVTSLRNALRFTCNDFAPLLLELNVKLLSRINSRSFSHIFFTNVVALPRESKQTKHHRCRFNNTSSLTNFERIPIGVVKWGIPFRGNQSIVKVKYNLCKWHVKIQFNTLCCQVSLIGITPRFSIHKLITLPTKSALVMIVAFNGSSHGLNEGSGKSDGLLMINGVRIFWYTPNTKR
jgi:hypothetical protein